MSVRLTSLTYAALLLTAIVLSLLFMARFHTWLGSSKQAGADVNNLLIMVVGLALGLPAFALLRRIPTPHLGARRSRHWLVVVLALSVALRIAWLSLVPTDPQGDYAGYHMKAIGLA